MAKPPKVYIVKRRLATNQIAHYHYAWKGGPRITGEPGSPEYHRSLAQHIENRKKPYGETLAKLIAAFQNSADYKRLSTHTERAYKRHLAEIHDMFGDMPIASLDDRRVRRHFLDLREKHADKPRTADMAMGTLKRLLSWSVEVGYIATNQAEPIARLHSADKSDDVWTQADVDAFAKHARPELVWVVLLAIATGLRQGDLIRLSWNHVEADRIVMRTSKRRKRVEIPLTADCKTLLASIPRRSTTVLTTSKGHRAWTGDGLRASFGKVCTDAGISLTFHDLRGTAVTEALANGIDAVRLALYFGWSEKRVEDMKRIYGSRTKIVESVLATLDQSGYENASETKTEKRTEKR